MTQTKPIPPITQQHIFILGFTHGLRDEIPSQADWNLISECKAGFIFVCGQKFGILAKQDYHKFLPAIL